MEISIYVLMLLAQRSSYHFCSILDATIKVGEAVTEIRVSKKLGAAQGIRSEGEESDDDDNIVRDF